MASLKLILIVLLTSIICQKSRANTTTVESVRECIKHIKEETSFKKRNALAIECHDLALELANSKSVVNKALYLITLARYLEYSGSDRYYFESIGNKLMAYFSSHLEHDLTISKMKRMSDKDLLDLYSAIHDVELYAVIVTSNESASHWLSIVFNEVLDRNLATDYDIGSNYRALLNRENLNEARVFLKKWSSVIGSDEFVPQLIGNNPLLKTDIGYYTLSADFENMILEKADFTKGPKVVILGDCHYALDALKQLNLNATYSLAIKNIGSIVVTKRFSEFKKLVKQFPDYKFHPIYREWDWFQAGFDIFSSPTFVFLLDGVPKYIIPRFGKYLNNDFCRGLVEIGQIEPNECESAYPSRSENIF